MAECHCGKEGHALNSINCSIHGCLADEAVNRVARAIAAEWFGKVPPEGENEWWLAGLVSAHKLARAAITASKADVS